MAAYRRGRHECSRGACAASAYPVARCRDRFRMCAFFFQADDGIRATSVTGVQTCALPISELCSPEEAAAYLRAFRAVLIFLEVCDGNMEEGSLRCDANISLRPRGQTELGTKVEIKNLNSFRNVQRALEFEARRQAQALDAGELIVQETRLWEADRGYTRSMRSK